MSRVLVCGGLIALLAGCVTPPSPTHEACFARGGVWLSGHVSHLADDEFGGVRVPEGCYQPPVPVRYYDDDNGREG